MSDPVSTPAKRNHFVLTQHGSHGKPEQLHYLAKHCEAVLGPSVLVWNTNVNQKRNTDSGLMVCCDRLWPVLTAALDEFIADNIKQGSTRMFFSCIGHSFGGLIIREIAFRLHREAKYSVLEFHTFATLATPHLGVTDMHACLKKGALFVGNLKSVAYLELLLEKDTLYRALVDDDHLAALKKFHQRLLYANTYDHLVSFASGTLQFELLPKVVNTEKGAPPPEPFSEIHPHVLKQQQATSTDIVPESFDKRAKMIRDRLLAAGAAGDFTVFPTHFAFRGINISHAYIVGMGLCRGKYCQDVSHHVALQMLDVSEELRTSSRLKKNAGAGTPSLSSTLPFPELSKGEEDAHSTVTAESVEAELLNLSFASRLEAEDMIAASAKEDENELLQEELRLEKEAEEEVQACEK